MPDEPVTLSAERLDGSLRGEVEFVGAEADDLAAEGLERVGHQQELTTGVYVAALPTLRVPGVADLDAIDLGMDVVETRAADDRAAAKIAHGPRQHAAFALASQRELDVGPRFRRRRHGREPKLPQLAVGRGIGKVPLVTQIERLQMHAVAFELYGTNRYHGRAGLLTATTSRTRRP